MIRNLELLSQGSQAVICSGLLRMGRVGLDGLSYSGGLKHVYSRMESLASPALLENKLSLHRKIFEYIMVTDAKINQKLKTPTMSPKWDQISTFVL